MASSDGCGIKYRKMIEFRRSRKSFRKSSKQRLDSTTLDFISGFTFTSESGTWPFSKTLTAVASIAPVYADSVWINCFGSKEITLITRDGKHKRRMSFSERISHTAVLNTGEIILASDMGHTVKKVTQKGKIEVVFDISPLNTRGICSMQDGGFLVCAVDQNGGKLYKRSIWEHNSDVYELDEKGKLLFLHPYRAIENINGDICVADIDAYCVTCVDQTGKLKFRYSGSKRKETMCRFCPYGLTNSKQGEIIVLDYWNHCVHLLNSDGHFIQFIMTQHEKVHYPLCAAVDRNDCLWIGCKDGKVTVVKFSVQS